MGYKKSEFKYIHDGKDAQKIGMNFYICTKNQNEFFFKKKESKKNIAFILIIIYNDAVN